MSLPQFAKPTSEGTGLDQITHCFVFNIQHTVKSGLFSQVMK